MLNHLADSKALTSGKNNEQSFRQGARPLDIYGGRSGIQIRHEARSACTSCAPPLTVSSGWHRTELRWLTACTLATVPESSWRSSELSEKLVLTLTI